MAGEMRLIDAAPLIADGWVLERHGISNVIIGRKSLADIPVVDPGSLRRKGQWVHDPTYTGKHKDCYVCSVCNHWQKADRKHENPKKMMYMRFCPYCGADMRERTVDDFGYFFGAAAAEGAGANRAEDAERE